MIEFTNKETTTTLRFWKETCGPRCLARRTATSRRAGRPVALYWHFGFAFASCPKPLWPEILVASHPFPEALCSSQSDLDSQDSSVATACAQKIQLRLSCPLLPKLRFAQSARKKLKNILPNNLVKLQYFTSLPFRCNFTNPDFPEIREFPLLNHLLSWGRVRSL